MSDVRNSTQEQDSKRHFWGKLFVFGLFALLLIVLYHSGLFAFFLDRDRMTAFLDSLGPFSFIGFILLQATQVVLAPIPGEATGLIGGYIYGPTLGVALSSAGLVLGSFLAFCLSRRLGRPFVDRFINKSLMDRFDYLLHHKGLFLVFLLFLMPGFPKDYLCFILGLGRLSIMEFLVVNSLGRLFGTILLTLGGGYIRYQQYGKLSILFCVAVVGTLLMLLFRQRIENTVKELHLRHQKKL